jgi:hypothetical protein
LEQFQAGFSIENRIYAGTPQISTRGLAHFWEWLRLTDFMGSGLPGHDGAQVPAFDGFPFSRAEVAFSMSKIHLNPTNFFLWPFKMN